MPASLVRGAPLRFEITSLEVKERGKKMGEGDEDEEEEAEYRSPRGSVELWMGKKIAGGG